MGLNQLGDYLNQALWNENVASLEAAFDKTVGRGVLKGCALTDGGGLVLNIGAGTVAGAGAALVVESQAFTVPDDATVQIQIDASTGTITSQAGLSDPGAPLVVLGRVTAASGALTVIAETGRVWLLRTDPSEPGVYRLGSDAVVIDPSTGITAAGQLHGGSAVITGTSTLQGAVDCDGTFNADGAATLGSTLAVTGAVTASDDLSVSGQLSTAEHFSPAVNEEVISADKTLTATDPNLQVLEASGATRKLILPTGAYGMSFTVMNKGDTNAIDVRDPGDTTTIESLAAGEVGVYAYQPASGGGSAEWGISAAGASGAGV